MSHTPGPWSFDESDATIFARITHHYWREGVIASVKDTCAEGKELAANARLIAAAPELLEALKEVVALSDRKHNAWDKAHAAIAKAEGRR